MAASSRLVGAAIATAFGAACSCGRMGTVDGGPFDSGGPGAADSGANDAGADAAGIDSGTADGGWCGLGEYISIAPTRFDFGTACVGGGPCLDGGNPTFVVSWNNPWRSSGPLLATFDGPEATMFGLSADTCSGKTVTEGQSCQVQVEFSPTNTGPMTASLSLVEMPCGDNAAAALTGNGSLCSLLSINPGFEDFGTVLVGFNGPPVAFNVSNPGSCPTDVFQTTMNGANASDFVIVSNGCSVAPPSGGTCSISVYFRPSGYGSETATLSVSSQVAGVASATLNGTGIAQTPLTIAPTLALFGNVAVGQSSPATTFTVTNDNVATTGILNVGLSGSGAGEYAVETGGTCSGQKLVGGGGSCSLSVVFVPTTPGAASASLTVSDGTTTGTVVATLSGVGTTPPDGGTDAGSMPVDGGAPDG